jgi:hypothetical protein
VTYVLTPPAGSPNSREYITVEASNPAALVPLAQQYGQKLVDQDGTVHTVVEHVRDPANPALITSVKVTPPISADLDDWVTAYGAARMVFTPQVPASVSVVTIRPPTPPASQ